MRTPPRAPARISTRTGARTTDARVIFPEILRGSPKKFANFFGRGQRPRPAPAMSGRPVKRSLTLRGHRTSVSLEDEFWTAFRHIAADRSLPVNVLAAEIDAARDPGTGLASAIRVFVLDHYRRQAGG